MKQRDQGFDHRGTALTFLKCFCDGDVDGLEPLLSSDLQVNGSLYQFSSRDTYLASLRAGPPDPSTYEVLSVTEADNTVAVFYNYRKAAGDLTVAQLFRFENRLIAEMRLVFDTGGLG